MTDSRMPVYRGENLHGSGDAALGGIGTGQRLRLRRWEPAAMAAEQRRQYPRFRSAPFFAVRALQ